MEENRATGLFSTDPSKNHLIIFRFFFFQWKWNTKNCCICQKYIFFIYLFISHLSASVIGHENESQWVSRAPAHFFCHMDCHCWNCWPLDNCIRETEKRDAEDTSAAVSLPAVLWRATGFTRRYIKGYTSSPLSCAEPQAGCVWVCVETEWWLYNHSLLWVCVCVLDSCNSK